jgi:photosystem II stability/assembly factor-like uncharacterized protein
VPASANPTIAVGDALSTGADNNTSSAATAGAAIESTIESTKTSKLATLQMQPELPSHLPAVSIASNTRQRLAIDTAGALFRSEDAGVTWRPIPAQWAGRAVRVGLSASQDQKMVADEAASRNAASADAKRSAGLPSQSAVFQLTTDTGDLWISADGQTWNRK